MKKIIFVLTIALIGNVAFAQSKKIDAEDVQKLYEWMQGDYSSKSQSKSDTSYFNISLKMKPCWQFLNGEYWLYVEQAMATLEDKPYRQRVYRLQLVDDTTITSTVYTIKDGEKYYGDWRKKNPLENVTTVDLEARKGCKIYIHKKDKNTFVGSTKANDCESSLKGAAYATTTVEISKNKVISWDRGFDKDGEQVWGATKGGYIFKK
jgi:hypothetical protein